ncbi:MAG: sulfatase [Bryobacterales bacterium]|nr:sulfatase [Bryobacterales bacterium]
MPTNEKTGGGWRRRDLLKAGLAPAILRGAADPKRPNILLILADDQRWDTLGCMGNPIIQTPHIDRLARGGVVFDNNFVTTAICCSSRASIFTGLHERSNGIADFATHFHEADRPNTYYNLLRRAGYRTGFAGKFGVGTAMPASDFDYWRGFGGQGKSENVRNGKPIHMTQILTEDTLEFLDTNRTDQPFCFSLSPKAAHADDPEPRQFIPEPDLMALYENVRIPHPPGFGIDAASTLPPFLRAADTEMRLRFMKRFATEESFQTMVKNYYRLVSGLDRMTGRLVQRLEERGLADNTVILYTSDNGFFLGERGMADKWMMYEPSIRTPLVIHDPRRKQGARRREMTLNIDLAPTMLELAGVEAPPHLQGRSLLPLMRSAGGWPRREFFYEHHFTKGVVIPRCEGVRTEDWKYTRYLDAQPVHEELYHLARDPNEASNMAQADEARAGQMRTRWQRWTEALAGWKRGARWQDPS